MFGCCVAGRLLQTNLQQVDETHALIELPAASSINHLCVFLLGTVAFPAGYGATVHLYWPGKGFQLLGMLSNDKPSAIFRLRGTFNSNAPTPTQQSAFTSTSSEMNASAATDVTAVLGFSMEPLVQIEPQISALASALVKPTPAANPTLLAEKIVTNLFHYISSFLGGQVTQEVTVPMTIIVKWYEGFLAKVRAGGTGFLERSE